MRPGTGTSRASNAAIPGELIRVQGAVQEVVLRPNLWRLATDCGLSGEVWSDAGGVVIRVFGPASGRQRFLARLREEAPPLVRIHALETEPAADGPRHFDFRILASPGADCRTGIVPDVATCQACLAELKDPGSRRYGYAFVSCTHCGPRLSIVRSAPCERMQTSMADFAMCPACLAEHADASDRHFHTASNCCPDCGPRLAFEDAAGVLLHCGDGQALAAARTALAAGLIVAIKGVGGFQLAADACNPAAVERLRSRKARAAQPFALMAADVATIRRYCSVDATEEALLASPAAPIVILAADGPEQLAAAVAPGLPTLAFMLPCTPLHHLLLGDFGRPLVMTGANAPGEPLCIANDAARRQLAGIADRFLLHERSIVNRIDDSLARVSCGAPRLLRRARGYAPASLPLPPGLADAPPLLAMGGDRRNAFCVVRDGKATLSPHIGDLENMAIYADMRRNLAFHEAMLRHRPSLVVVDAQADSHATRLGRERARQEGLAVVEAQHHHAHFASCLAENGVPADAAPALGLVLDGLGHGADGTLWGGEFLLGGYRTCARIGHLRAVPLPGGPDALEEPWRSTYSHIVAAIGWQRFAEEYGHLELHGFLRTRPLRMLDSMLERGANCPRTSSCGRLLDAVAAAVGICRERITYEGQAAIELEACVDAAALAGAGHGYSFRIDGFGPLAVLDATPMWSALLDDLARRVAVATIAARFHIGFARALVHMCAALAAGAAPRPRRVALSGGVFHNTILLEQVGSGLRREGFEVLSHAQVPAGDGGLALGQAAIGAAHALAKRTGRRDPARAQTRLDQLKAARHA